MMMRTGNRSRSSALFQPERPTEKRGDAMSKKLVKRTVDLANLPSLTKRQKADLANLSARPDSEIDFSYIPPLTENFWKIAVRGKYYKPTKTSTNVRIDSEFWLGSGLRARATSLGSTPSCGVRCWSRSNNW
jgi:hypothetical protein